MPAIKYKKKTYAGATFPVLEMTKAEYDALPDAKKMDGTVYMITDDNGGWEAERSTYDNTTSGLTATNVQDALDELNSNKANVNHNHNDLYAKIKGPKTIANNATETISLENSSRWLLVTTVFGNCGLYFICRAGNGTPAVQNLIAHNYVTVSTSGQNITVKASGGQGVDIMLIRVN